VELLAALIVVELGVRVVVDDFDCPLGILELHLLLAVALTDNMLLTSPLVGRCAVVTGLLLLLLVKLLCNLLDLSSLLRAMAHGVVHWAPRPALVTAGGLVRSLVAAWAVAPTTRYCESGGSGSACHFFFFLFLFLPLL
jgi:hypothetical protein